MKQLNVPITLFGLLILFALNTSAQIPQRFNYQCALRDASGGVLANTGVSVRFTFRQNDAVGPVRYQEKHLTTTNEFGLVNLNIGAGEVSQFSWGNLYWSEYLYVLQVEVDLGNGFVDMGTSTFNSVPYALLSERATNMNLGELNDVETYMGVNEGDVLRFNSDENYWQPGKLSLDDLSDVNYEELPVDGDQLVYSDYFAEWVPSSVVPGFGGNAWNVNGADVFQVEGNVGIGTDTPVTGLHIHNKQGLRLTTTFTGSSWLDGFYIGQDWNNSNVILSNFENGPIIFLTGFAERFRLDENGPTVPLDSPGNKFHLKSTYQGLGMHFTYANSGHNETDGVKMGLNGSSALVINQQENADITFIRYGWQRLNIHQTGTDIIGDLNVFGNVNVTGELTSDLIDVGVGSITVLNTVDIGAQSVEVGAGGVTSIGDGQFQNMNMNGYTRLGNESPAIKLKKIAVPFGECNDDYDKIFYSIPIGIVTSHVLSYSVAVQFDSGGTFLYTPDKEDFEFNHYIEEGYLVLNHECIPADPNGQVLILITYED